ncbi:MAG: hypothetical protein HOV83_07480, partial [Catenulispora sp.]|nr:hypothetical protein [Catenulispora sp.]
AGNSAAGGSTAGNIQVSWDGGSTIVGCAGEVSHALVTLAAPGVLPVEIKGDDAARGHAGAAVVVTSPSLMALRNAFPAGATPVMAGEAVTDAERRDAGRLPADGDYELVVGCVGPTPTVVVTVTPADGVGARTVKCGRLENGALTGRPTVIALPHRSAGAFEIRLTVPYRTMIVKYALRRVTR